MSVAQHTINLNNTLSGISSQTQKGTNTLINFTGQNSYSTRELSLDLLTNYQIAWSPTLTQNELIQSINVGYRKPTWDLFTTYQYNHSLLRKIESDNWLGLGGGVKKDYTQGKLSLSYATIHQRTNYTMLPDRNLFRHSFRGRIKWEKKLFSINSEYFFQPSFKNIEDYIVFGTSKVTFFPDKRLGFTIQNTLNYRSFDTYKMIQNTTAGVTYKFTVVKN